MTDEDIIDLILFLDSGSSMAIPMSRRTASDTIKDFHTAREDASALSWWKYHWHRLRLWRRPFTVSFGDGDYNVMVVDAKRVIAMCIHERGTSCYEKVAESQKIIAEAIKREQEERLRGEEWCSDDDDEE